MNKATEKLMYECTIEGFINDFNTSQFKNDVDTINNAIAYILKHGMHNDYVSCDINELIYTARNEVAKSIARKQLENDSKDLTNMQQQNKEDSEEVRQFLVDPLKYMAGKIKDEYFVDMIHYDDPSMNPVEKKQHRIDYFLNAKRLAFDFEDERFKEAYKEYEKNVKKDQTFTNQLTAKYAANDTTIAASIVKQKAGFFEHLFNTTSEEYNNFKAAYRNFYNPEHELYGDDEVLKDAAMGYLKHKFPNITEDKLPTEEEIKKLSGAGKERAAFCLNVVNVYKENHELQEQADKLIKEAKLYDEFKNVYDKFMDQDASFDEHDGDELVKSAMAYVKFKFPNLEQNKLPTDEQIEAFGDEKIKERVTLCLDSMKDYLDIEDTNSSIFIEDNNKKVPLYQFLESLEKDVDVENKNVNDDSLIFVEDPKIDLDNSK